MGVTPGARASYRWLKPVVFVLCLVPLMWLGGRALSGDLGANPIEAVVRFLGDWALRFILIALAVTPLRQFTGWTRLASLRRMLGLFAFLYVVLHMLSYVGLDRFFDMASLWEEILKRRYITVGMLSFLLLLPLAITSTDAMIRRLGGMRWRRLHRLVYPAAVAAVFHYFMMIKAGFFLAQVHAAVLALLLGARVYSAMSRRVSG